MPVRSLSLLFLMVPLLAGAAPQAPDSPRPTKASAGAEKVAPSLDALRKRCYGGRGAKASTLELSAWDRSALQAAARANYERFAHWTLKALRGHGDESRLIPSYVIAKEGTESRLSDEELEACNRLLERLPAGGDSRAKTKG